jgi:hypothetical protein
VSWIKGYRVLGPEDARLLNEHATRARAAFEEWAGDVDATRMPPDVIDAMQWRLQLWQRSNFGCQPDVNQVLGMIEEVGETLGAERWDDVLDGIGDTCVYAGQVLIGNRMALRPVLDLAEHYVDQWYGGNAPCPEACMGMLAHVVLKHEQRIRDLAEPNMYRIALADTMARCIASTLLHAMYLSDGSINVRDIYISVGSAVLKRNWVHNSSTG